MQSSQLWALITLIAQLNIFSKTVESKLTVETPEPELLVLLALQDILRDKFPAEYHEAWFYRQATHEAGTNSQIYLLNEILGQINGSRSVRVEERIPPRKIRDAKRLLNVIIIDGFVSFRKILRQLTVEKIDPDALFVVLIIPRLSSDQLTIVRSILDLCWAYKITNVVVLPGRFTTAQQQTSVYTFYPFTNLHCERVVPVIQTLYSRRLGFPPSAQLFPNKYRNMHGCQLSVTTYSFAPYIIYRPGSTSTFDGIDGHVLRSLERRMRFRAHVITHGDRGQAYGLRNGTGCFGLVQNDLANFTMGNLGYSSQRADYLRASTPLYFTSIRVVVPPGMPFTALQKLLLPFRPELWMLMATVVSAAAAVLLLLGRCTSVWWQALLIGPDRAPILATAAIALGVSVTRLPRRNFARFMFVCWTILMFVMRNTYQGYLCYFLQRDRRRPRPQQMADLRAANYTFCGEEGMFSFVQSVPQLKGARFRICENQLASIGKLTNATEDIALMVSEAVIGFFNMLNIRRGVSVPIPKERVMLIPIVIYTAYNSSYESTMNEWLGRMISVGLMDHWTEVMAIQREVSDDDAIEPRKLVVQQVLGTFAVCGVLLVAACVAFVLELLVFNIRKCANVYTLQITIERKQ